MRSFCHVFSMSDLIQRVARERDPEAFRDLFRTYGPRVKAMMMRQGVDADTAEDIAQETLLLVWRKAHLFVEQKGSIATWIYTIARNVRIDRIRRQMPVTELPEDLNGTPSDEELPDDTLNREQQRQRIREALATLPADQYEVVQLSYIEGLSHQEIAERTGAPLGTIKSRMRLAYQKIREAVGEDI
jgi:RNA polymerase sigma-70 factor (ECF subfamily)